MPVVTVRPDGVASGASAFDVTVAADAAEATNDDSDSTFVRKDSGVSGTATLSLTFDDATIGASERVKRVRLRARVQTDTAAGKMDLMLGTRVLGLTYFYTGYAVRGANAAATTFTGAWFSSSPDGASWDQARIDALRSQFIEYRDASDRGYLYELFIDIDKATKPTLVVDSPTGTLTTTATPEIAWTYTDPDSADPQAFYQVKIYSAAMYSASGFDPDISTPLCGCRGGTGIVPSSEPGTVVGEPLLSGTYRAYVRVAKAVNAQPFFSDWEFTQFTLDLTPPPTVAVDAAWDSSEGLATLTLTGGDEGAGFTSQYFQVQRSNDGGSSWSLLRNGDDIGPDGSFEATVLDYEAPRGLTVRYRARSIGVSGEERIPSDWSAAIPQVLVTNDGTWWLKAVADPSLNTGSVRVQNPLSISVEEPHTVFRPLGTNLPIVVTGLIGGEDATLEILTMTDAEWTSIEDILLHQGVLLIQSPQGDQRYARVVTRSWDESYSVGRLTRRVTVSYYEVDG